MRQCILIYINNEQKMVKNLPTLLSSLDNNVVGKQKQFEWTWKLVIVFQELRKKDMISPFGRENGG